MSSHSVKVFFAGTLFFLCWPTAYAEDFISFGPSLGRGQDQQGSQVTQNGSGRVNVGFFSQSLESWQVTPLLGFLNSYQSSKKSESDREYTLYYDQRIFTGGLRLTRPNKLLTNRTLLPYLGVSYGKGWSKVVIKEQDEQSFMEHSYTGAESTFQEVELGLGIPINDEISFSVSLAYVIYTIDQSQLAGAYEGQVIEEEGQFLLTGSQSKADIELANESEQRVYSLGFGLVFNM